MDRETNPFFGFLSSQFDALACTETHLQYLVCWLDIQQVKSLSGLWPMLVHELPFIYIPLDEAVTHPPGEASSHRLLVFLNP